VVPEELLDDETDLPHQPDRPLRGRRPAGRLRADRPQDHRRHLRRRRRHGGGAFSGKDPTKVDRSASYMARHIAKNLVAAGVAERLEVQLAYAIGVPEPVSIHISAFGTGKMPEARLQELVRELFPLSPRGIIDYLQLQRPIYRRTAAYGHFGRDGSELPWEDTRRAEEIRAKAGLSGGVPATPTF
jgi:S-adenosylmethionine synthetase